MSLFTSGDNGTFDTTTDPNGNPPSDWNITKATDSIVRFTDANPITGTGSMHVESRTIFNDDYALFVDNKTIDDKYKVANLGLNFINLSTDFTFELRLYITSDVATQFIYNIDTDDINGRAGLRIQKANNNLRFQYFNNENTLFRVIDVPITVNNWYHVVVSWNNGVEARMYVNNVKYTTTSNISMGNSNITSHTIGNLNSSGSNPLIGYVRGVRFFQNYNASDSDVNNLYNNSNKNIQPIPISMISSLTYEYLLNQEQSRYVNETHNQIDGELNEIFSNEEVSFGGGAWVDVSAIN